MKNKPKVICSISVGLSVWPSDWASGGCIGPWLEIVFRKTHNDRLIMRMREGNEMISWSVAEFIDHNESFPTKHVYGFSEIIDEFVESANCRVLNNHFNANSCHRGTCEQDIISTIDGHIYI